VAPRKLTRIPQLCAETFKCPALGIVFYPNGSIISWNNGKM